MWSGGVHPRGLPHVTPTAKRARGRTAYPDNARVVARLAITALRSC